jgi:RNA polymerase sigma factor (sigma-70 family)
VGKETVQIIDAAAFLESNLPLVEAVVGEIARRQRVRGDALEDFKSLAFMKLVEHDYDVLRRFQGNSSLRTYLTVVLQRVLLDYRNREWGRWRASAAASRIGPVAVSLERLVTRDGLTPGEAMAAIGPHADVSGCQEFVETLGGRAPVRGSRTTLGEDAIPEGFDPGPGPDAVAERREQADRADAVRTMVRDALRSLDSQDHLILTLHFRDGLSVADTARVLGVDSKPLYRRIDRILARLQAILCTDELRTQLVRDLARDSWSDFVDERESGWWRPSNHPNGPGSDVRDDLGHDEMPRRGAPRRVHRRPAPEPLLAGRAASF